MKATLMAIAMMIIVCGCTVAGNRYGFQFDVHSLSVGSDSVTDPGIGFRSDWQIEHFMVITSINYYFIDYHPQADETLFDLNMDAAYNFAPRAKVRPFAGAGVNVAHISLKNQNNGLTASNTSTAFSVAGGVEFPVSQRILSVLEINYVHHSKLFAVENGWIPTNRVVFSAGILF